MAIGSLFSGIKGRAGGAAPAAAAAAAAAAPQSDKAHQPASASAPSTAKAKATAASAAASKKVDAAMDQIKVIITGDKSSTAPSSVTGMESVTSTCPSLNKKQRLMGFGACFVIGYLISFGSTFALISGSDNGAKFGVTYTIGNVIALCGSGFLVGPCQQVKLMMKPVRRVAAIIYLGMMVIVLGVAIGAPHLGGLVLFLVFIQFVAAVWYSASYVPFGRKIITSVCTKVCGGSVGS